MNIPRLVIITVLILSLATWSDLARTQEADPSSEWSAKAARTDAARAVANGQAFLYTSGGFVCSPKFDEGHADLAKGLPVKPLACGCVLTGLSGLQSKYARVFNDHILSLLAAEAVRSGHSHNSRRRQ